LFIFWDGDCRNQVRSYRFLQDVITKDKAVSTTTLRRLRH